ncbi:PIG-L family deacetylase [Acidicapsa dinghuensis]|uniref:PIG-L family deacetylase n=1 Tax=Acidicapsa dinghuensis TaxID=2218256 RepID=A0ABW1EDB4_9BACT|nr:PIG-L family deacetylase [Acidicapsa dinghuensis]
MGFPTVTKQLASWLAMASLLSVYAPAQQSPATPHTAADHEPTPIALPLAEDRGAAALEQSLKRLSTWASVMDIVAHPDDEDGAMLTYESRGQGVRASLMTLTRGEGGQNAMGTDDYDALGLIRTNELLRADEFYGVKQYFGTEADFGFSKTQEESFERWGHERVLCDTVLAVREERPLVLVSTFVGGITDGHGQHQVSGEVSQEAYLDAGNPKVCPEQIAAGLKPWSPRKVYARAPFAPVTDKGMFDYATGKWAPAKFYNYVTKQWTTTAPSADVSIPSGKLDPVLGRSYVQISREGWGEQKSQYGGANPTLSGGGGSEYHRYGSRVAEKGGEESSYFEGIPTGIEGMTSLVSGPAPTWLASGLKTIAEDVERASREYKPEQPDAIAPVLKAGYEATKALDDRVASSELKDLEKYDLAFELSIKMQQFQAALGNALGLDLQAFTTRGGSGVEETPRSVVPGQQIQVVIHTGNGFGKAKLRRVWLGDELDGASGEPWKSQPVENPGADQVVKATVPEDAKPTEPYFSRPTIEQPYYDVANAAYRDQPFSPYPLAAWAEFDYEGVPVRLSEVVQTMRREPGRGGIFEPLVITPEVGVIVEPAERILPLDGSALPVRVTVHTERAASGTVRLTLPAGWMATPEEATFKRSSAGDSEPSLFQVKPSDASKAPDGEINIQAEARIDGHAFTSGWRTVGYPGLRPYNLYRKAEMKTRAVDVKLAPGLRVGYIMGTGDMVPQAIEGLGITPHLLSASEVTSGDLSAYDVIMVGIRAYSVRPELAAAQTRLNAWVENGGTLVVQYQSNTFPAPFALQMGRTPERVVEEDAPVKILDASDTQLSWPNQITAHDFDGWVEERGHSFLDTWDPAYTALTETADHGQNPQHGGWLVAHPGKGTYVYISYAIYRQLPELVPGAYRILANLLSAPKAPR